MRSTESARSETSKHSLPDVVFDAFFSGGIGGSLVALFFLGVDAIRAEPLFTPSLMGSVIFGGADAASVQGVDLGMVAAYSLLHFLSFCLLGLVASLTVHEVELHAKHPALVLLVLFLIFEGAFALAAGVFAPGAIARVGPLYVAAANLLAAAGMGVFFLTSHQPASWQRIKATVGI